MPEGHSRLYWFSHFLQLTLSPRDECLMWVIEHGIWPSSENWHLFGRLRQSYGETRTLDEAPGHLFTSDEAADVTTFVEVSISCGWGFYLLTSGPRQAFLSHDEYVDFVVESEDASGALIAELKESRVRILRP